MPLTSVVPLSRLARAAAAVVLAIAALLAAAAAQAEAAPLRQWKIDFAVAPSTNTAFGLINHEAGEQVRYRSRRFGINLVYDSGSNREWRLERTSGSTGPLRWDEPLALKNLTIGKYVHYKERDYGINLDWTTTRTAQWRLRGGTAGTQIPGGYLVSIYNDVEPDYLIHGAREFGINLCWASDFHMAWPYLGWNC